jgi:hypothetical protein
MGAWLLKKVKLLPQQTDARVVVVALSFETAENSLTLEYLQLHGLYFVVVVWIEGHLVRQVGASASWVCGWRLRGQIRRMLRGGILFLNTDTG